jgi:hypothetical protein
VLWDTLYILRKEFPCPGRVFLPASSKSSKGLLFTFYFVVLVLVLLVVLVVVRIDVSQIKAF